MTDSDLKYATEVANTYAHLTETVSKELLKATLDQQQAQEKQLRATAELCANILRIR